MSTYGAILSVHSKMQEVLVREINSLQTQALVSSIGGDFEKSKAILKRQMAVQLTLTESLLR